MIGADLSEAFVAKTLRSLTGKVPPEWLPIPGESGSGFLEYASGYWGTAMPTRSPGVTLKITTEKAEALAAAVMIKTYGAGWVEGVARHYAVFKIKGADAYLLWREAIVPNSQLEVDTSPVHKRLHRAIKDLKEVTYDLFETLSDEWGSFGPATKAMVAEFSSGSFEEDSPGWLLNEYLFLATEIAKMTGGERLGRGLVRMFHDGIITLDVNGGNLARLPSADGFALFDLGMVFYTKNFWNTKIPVLR